MIYESVDSTVRSLLAAKGMSMHYYMQFLYYAKEEIRELGFDVWTQVRTAKITLNAINAWQLPQDFVDVVLVGEENGQYVRPYLEEKKLNRTRGVNTQGNLIKRQAVESLGHPCSYILLRERGEIQFDCRVTKEAKLLLYYITDDSRLAINSVIHPYCINTLKRSMEWQYERDKIRKNLSHIQEAKREYQDALMILRGRKNRLTKEKIIQMLYEAKVYGVR